MKKFLPALAGWICLAGTQPLLAQTSAPCALKGIRTDPAAPALNTEYSTRTNTFNWYYGNNYGGRWWSLNSQSLPYATDIWMPWEQSDNANMTHILGKRDLPGDGWELIKRNMGFDDAGARVAGLINPYVILYNKYSGMLRVFVATGTRAQDYQFAEIKLVFNRNGALKKAGTLNRMEGIGTALADTPPGTGAEFSAVARFLNQDTKWFMADFPMEYDPCACQFDSKLKVEVNLISSADVRLKGVTTGTLMTTNSSTGTTTTSSDFDQAVTLAKKVNGVIKSSQSTYKTIGSYSSSILKKITAQGSKSSAADADVKKAAFSQLTAALGSSGFLKNGLKAAPYIGAAVSILDSFFGGGKDSGSQPVSLQPMSIEMTTQLTGTISATALYETVTFNNPGTRLITTREEYPYYNEAMGVLSVLERPVLERRILRYTSEVSNRIVYQYRLAAPIRYVINPAAGLDVQDFQVSLLQEGQNYPQILPGANTAWYYEGLTAAGAHVMRTDYTDAACFANNVVELDLNSDRFQPEGAQEFVVKDGFHQTYLKLLLNLRPRSQSATRQNVLLVLKYPVTIRNVSEFTPQPPYACGVQAQVNATSLQALCTGPIYAAAIPAPAPVTSTVSDVHVYPNPTTSVSTLRFTGTGVGNVQAYLTDPVGRRVHTVFQGTKSLLGEQHHSFSTAGLSAGLYYCVVETSGGQKTTTRLIVVH